MLETAVNLWSLLALVLYLYAPRTLRPWQRAIWIGLAGACAGGAALTKVPGIALAGALAAPRPAAPPPAPGAAAGRARRWAACLLGLRPSCSSPPARCCARPSSSRCCARRRSAPGIDQASRIADYPESALTLLGAMLGMVVLTAAFLVARGRRERAGAARLGAWWCCGRLPVLAVFVVGPLLPLALLRAMGAASGPAGGGGGRPPGLAGHWRGPAAAVRVRRLVADAGAAFGLLFILPLIVCPVAGRLYRRDRTGSTSRRGPRWPSAARPRRANAGLRPWLYLRRRAASGW